MPTLLGERVQSVKRVCGNGFPKLLQRKYGLLGFDRWFNLEWLDSEEILYTLFLEYRHNLTCLDNIIVTNDMIPFWRRIGE